MRQVQFCSMTYTHSNLGYNIQWWHLYWGWLMSLPTIHQLKYLKLTPMLSSSTFPDFMVSLHFFHLFFWEGLATPVPRELMKMPVDDSGLIFLPKEEGKRNWRLLRWIVTLKLLFLLFILMKYILRTKKNHKGLLTVFIGLILILVLFWNY